MKDIAGRNDIDKLMKAFYAKAITDDIIGFYFTSIVHLDLEKHLPVIVDFWDNVLFATNNYTGDPIKIHQHINQLSSFEDVHFNRWVLLFCTTVNELFEGENAEKVKQRAQSIATVMKIKIIHQGIQNKIL